MYNKDRTKLFIDSLIVPTRNEAPQLSVNYQYELLEPGNCLLEWKISEGYKAMIQHSITNIISETDTQTVYIRVQASDSSFASKSQKIKLKPRPRIPVAKINYANEEIIDLNENEIFVFPNDTIPVTGKSFDISGFVPEYGQQADTLFLKVPFRDTTFGSLVQKLKIIARPAPTAYINYANEKITNPEGNEIFVSPNDIMPTTVKSFDISLNIPEYGQQADTMALKVPPTFTSFASRIQKLKIIARPAPPTNGLIDDKLNSFSWTLSKDGFNNSFDYEYSINAGKDWIVCNYFFINVGNIDLPAGNLLLRVSASSQRFKSRPLVSDQSFTKQKVSVSELHSSKVTVYPSVTKGYLTVLNPEGFDLYIYNSEGKLVKMDKNCSKGIHILDLSDRPCGVYFILIVNQSNERKTFKIIRQ